MSLRPSGSFFWRLKRRNCLDRMCLSLLAMTQEMFCVGNCYSSCGEYLTGEGELLMGGAITILHY